MDRPPRPVAEPLFSTPTIIWSLLQGALVLGVVTTILFMAPGYGFDTDQVRALTFHSLVLCVVALIFVDRSVSSSIVTAIVRPNRALAYVLPVVTVLLAVTIFWSPARDLFGFGALVALHLVVRGYPRDYYFAPMAVLGVLAFGGLSSRLAHAACGLLAVTNALALLAPRVAHTWQEQMAMAGRFVGDVTPSGEPLGCFNSGILAFHAKSPVINLDGVVNRQAFVALRAGELDKYLDARGVRFLVDSEIQFRVDDPWPHSSGAHFGGRFAPERDLVEIARCVVPGVREPFVVYWRRGRGEPPVAPTVARVLGPAPAHGARRGGHYVACPTTGPATLRLRAEGSAEPALTLAVVDRATVVIVRVDSAKHGRHGLFVDDHAAPILSVDL